MQKLTLTNSLGGSVSLVPNINQTNETTTLNFTGKSDVILNEGGHLIGTPTTITPSFLNSDTTIANAEFVKGQTYFTQAQVFEYVATIGAAGTSLVFDSSGNLYWAVSNVYNGTTYNQTSYVYKITPEGTLTTFASQATNGSYDNSLIFDSSGNLYWAVANYYNDTTYTLISYVYKITPAGTKTTFASQTLPGVIGTSLIFDSSGNLYWALACYYTPTTYNMVSYLFKITPAGTKSSFASQSATGGRHTALIFDSSGNLYWSVSNAYNGTTYNLTSYIFKITPTGTKTAFASVATNNMFGASLAFDSAENLYWGVSNNYNGTTRNLTSYVYKITPTGTMTTFASQATIGAAVASLVFDSTGNLYWGVNNVFNGTTYNLTSYIYKITPTGTKTTFASVDTIGAHGSSLVFDSAENLYWAVSNNFNGTTRNLTSYIYQMSKINIT